MTCWNLAPILRVAVSILQQDWSLVRLATRLSSPNQLYHAMRDLANVWGMGFGGWGMDDSVRYWGFGVSDYVAKGEDDPEEEWQGDGDESNGRGEGRAALSVA